MLLPDVSDDQWVIVGRFGRPHGIQGLVSVISFTDPLDNILDYAPWHVVTQPSGWTPLRLQHVETRNKLILAQVEGFPVREDVARLTNLDIAVPRQQLPSLACGEYYWHQLVGMTVVNRAGFMFGQIKEILPTGANDVLVVVGSKRYLIPYLPGRFVLEVDAVQQQVMVDWEPEF